MLNQWQNSTFSFRTLNADLIRLIVNNVQLIPAAILNFGYRVLNSTTDRFKPSG